MTPALAYIRVSSEGQRFGDGFDRQAQAIQSWADHNGKQIIEWYKDVITGTSDLDDRPGLAACLAHIEANGVRTVIVESADRLARDAMVFELSIREFKKLGARVVTASSIDLTEGGDDNPTGALIRGILGLIAEFDKRVIVLKLRAARNRKKQSHGKCEGRKAFGELPGEINTLEKIIECNFDGMDAEQLAVHLNCRFDDYPTRSGKPWRASVIRRIIAREKARHNSTAKPELTA